MTFVFKKLLKKRGRHKKKKKKDRAQSLKTAVHFNVKRKQNSKIFNMETWKNRIEPVFFCLIFDNIHSAKCVCVFGLPTLRESVYECCCRRFGFYLGFVKLSQNRETWLNLLGFFDSGQI